MTSSATDSRTVTACRNCGADVYWPAEVWRLLGGKPPASLCPECVAEADAAEGERQLAEAQRAREAAWWRLCPALYRATDPARLPQKQLAEVLRWEPGPEGLLLIGPTGSGKTRSMYLLARKLLDAGERITVFDSLAFGHEISRRFGDGTGESWAARLATFPVVLLDDLGKSRFTQRIESEMFGLIERRTANLLPIVATTNMVGADLARKMDADLGPPLVRRLREFCKVVVFG